MAFQSTAAAAARAIREVMKEQELREDRELQKRIEAEIRAEEKAERERLVKRQKRSDDLAEADRLAKIVPPDTDLDPEAADTFARGGYRVSKPFEATTRIAPVDSDLPGASDAPTVAMRSPNRQRSESFLERQARMEIERSETEKAEGRAFRDDQARAAEAFRRSESAANREFQGEQKLADRELKELIARLSASNNAESKALANQLKEIQIEQAREKLEGTRKEKADAARAVATSRATVRDLAQGLIDDKALDSITGAIEGRRNTFIGSKATDALARYEQLIGSLTVAERAKLKGQGAITDREQEMLAKSVTALNRATDPATVRKHLRTIVTIMGGGASSGGSSDFVVTVE